MSIHSKTTWLLVGDGASAQFYNVHAIPLRLAKVAAGTLRATRKLTHGSDHKPETRGIAHTGNYHSDHQRHEDVFVERIAETLDAAVRDDEFDDIIVVLPPRALAHFRKIAGNDVQKRIKREICGDWTHLAVPDLEAHLAAELP
jgi:protein required for attachment to host cells